jgi:hypothetical protein
MLGMRVNCHKSKIFPLGVENEKEIQTFVQIFGCLVGELPIKYLGILLHYQNLRREDLQPLVDKIFTRIVGWRGKLLTQAGRLVVIKACLASIPIYLLSFFKFPG